MTYDAGVARARYELGTEQFDAAIQRAKRGYAELQAAQEQALRPVNLPAVGGGGAGTPAASRAASFAQEQRAVASLEAQQARLARTQGDAARAAELEAQAQQTLSAALVRTDTTSAQALAIQRQLASVQTQAARGAQQATAGASSLAGELGRLGSAAAGLGLAVGVQQLVSFSISAGQAGLALDRTERLTQQLTGSQERYNEVIAAAKQQQLLFGGSLQENIEQLSGFAVQARLSGARMNDLIDVAQRLAVLDPGQGIAGAQIALREALSGDPISLARRFEIPRNELAKLRDTSTTTAQKLQVISDFLDKAGVRSGALAAATSETQQTYNQLNTTLDSATTKFGLFVAQGLEPAARGLDRVIRLTQGNTDALGEMTQGLQATNTTLGNALLSGVNPLTHGLVAYNEWALKAGQGALEWVGAVQTGTPAIQQQAQATNTLSQEQQLAALNTRLLAGEQAHLRDEHLQTGQIVQQTSAQVQEFNATLAASAVQAQISAAQSTILKQRQEDVAHSALLASQGMLGEGDQALLLARKLGIARDQAQLLINANQVIAGQAAFAAQRAGEQGRLPDDELRGRNRARDAADKLHQQYVDQEQQKQKQIADAQRTLDLARARTPAQRIAVYQRELAATTDVAERLRIQAQIEQEKASTARAHTTELGKQLNLEEKIRDSKEAQLKASIDARKLGAQDTLDRLKEDQQLAQARRVLATSHDERFRQAAQARIDLIGAERDSRALAIREAQATAGGAIVGGRVFQSIPGGGAPPALAPTPPLPGAQPARAQAPAATGTPPSGIQVLVFIDGDQVAAKVETRVVSDLRQSRQQSASGGGGVR